MTLLHKRFCNLRQNSSSLMIEFSLNLNTCSVLLLSMASSIAACDSLVTLLPDNNNGKAKSQLACNSFFGASGAWWVTVETGKSSLGGNMDVHLYSKDDKNRNMMMR